MFRLNLLGLLCLLFSTGLLAERLDLSQGAMMAGGSALVKYSSPDISVWSSDYLQLGISTNWGFFFMKDFALLFDIQLAGKLGTGFDVSRRYQFGSGVLYALDLDSNLYPYAQLIGYGAYVQDGWSAGVVPALGLLVGLTSQVALDFGVNARFDFPIYSSRATNLDIGAGYVGVRAFF
jgi:hypothetical protein